MRMLWRLHDAAPQRAHAHRANHDKGCTQQARLHRAHVVQAVGELDHDDQRSSTMVRIMVRSRHKQPRRTVRMLCRRSASLTTMTSGSVRHHGQDHLAQLVLILRAQRRQRAPEDLALHAPG